ncbi:hypothetical protein J6590_086736 [Homalodisca vitripennis]|nr:hypothetical protein J6590_086736 [Homalodisca vitripennis]
MDSLLGLQATTSSLESLGILGSLPTAWLILTLILLLVYLLTRCWDRKLSPALKPILRAGIDYTGEMPDILADL